MHKVLVVGQTPPPHHGQSIMIQKMLEAEYPGIRLYHARMAFSGDMEEIGLFKSHKIISLVRLILRMYWMRIRQGTRILYYPPAGPHWTPVLRDIAILLPTRWLFDKVIFHFHACGLSKLYQDGSPFARLLLRLAYFGPDAAVCASRLLVDDGRELGAKREFLVPCGVEDDGRQYLSRTAEARAERGKLGTILYVGCLSEQKGIPVLIEAAKRLAKRGCRYQLQFVGSFVSPDFRRIILRQVEQYELEEYVQFVGVLTGEAKESAYAAADIFCFPSQHPTETFGVVNIEAMSFGLPIVATAWRTVPEIVADGVTGFLVPVGDVVSLADRLEQLLLDPDLRERMGRAGRVKFETEFTIEKFRERWGQVFRVVASADC